ncbi:hypothetical protein FO440_15740 [Mucilaginibacter corticis]|uniref:Protein BatD n=1 Tax=Mucilaginibacter corticis TaxID=2597670 RepID=A0A556MHA8_9SPHI|nr:hypothetical protein [Mucilaginibacter corticis]TSJ39212.1 hypothetical protein FO440_15740 [Mucilaginibacter corticis]
MKKQFFNYTLLALLLACLSSIAKAQNIKVEAKLQDYTIKIGDQTRLFLEVNQPAKAHVNFPVFTDTITDKVQIVSANKPDTIPDKKDYSRITIIRSYVITSFDAGIYKFPLFSFGSSIGVIKSNELMLQVQTVKIDTTKSIYDIKQPILVNYTFFDRVKDNWTWIVIAIVVTALIIGLIIYLRNKPKQQPVIKITKPSIPIHIVAIDKLKELRDKKLWQQEEFKLYHSELTDIIREYLEKRYNIKTHEKTTDEILTALNNRDITGEYRNMLQQILVMADLVKFAKEKPLPLENERSLDNAIEFVLKTQQSVVNQADAEGGKVNV